MIATLLLPLLLQTAPDGHDPTWSQTLGWTVSRQSDGSCRGEYSDADGNTQVLRKEPDGAVTYAIQRADWGKGEGALAFVANVSGKAQTLTAKDMVRDGALGHGLYLDPEALRPLSWSMRVSLYRAPSGARKGKGSDPTKGEWLGDYKLSQMLHALDGMGTCVRSVAAERAPQTPLSGEGPATTLLAPQLYITDADYSSAALRAGEAGRVVFRLEIAEDGYPDACVLLKSSGSVTLDNTTCQILRWRMRFVPRLGADGKPIRQSFRSAINWTIPSD